MASFEKHIEALIAKEGGYLDHTVEGDRGGRTYAGISSRSHPNWLGWDLLRSGASPDKVKDAVHTLYRREYWDKVCGDQIGNDDVAEMLFSSAVNCGVSATAKMAQNIVKSQVDGIMGPITAQAINAMNPDMFEASFALSVINRYREICNRDRTQVTFLLGWLNRVYGELAS